MQFGKINNNCALVSDFKLIEFHITGMASSLPHFVTLGRGSIRGKKQSKTNVIYISIQISKIS